MVQRLSALALITTIFWLDELKIDVQLKNIDRIFILYNQYI